MTIDRNSVIAVVIPEVPHSTEQFAAEELVRYLRLSLDADAAVSHSWKKGAFNFVIGSPMRNRYASAFLEEGIFRESVPGPEGMYICIREEAVLLAGSGDNDGYDRGTLYAVYEFLERFAGCCFGAYSKPGIKAGEVIPRLEALHIGETTYIKKAADLPYRTAIVQYGCWAGNADHELSLPFIDWLAKNRYNRILTWASIYEQYRESGMIPELEKRGIRLSVGHHQASATWLPPYGNDSFPEKYAQKHPEFYRQEQDGSRFIPKNEKDYCGQLILCCRNPESVETIAQNIIRWIEENPIVDTIAFWPNDDQAPQCCCSACARHSKTENYLYFENELAKRVTAVHPEVRIDVLIYKDLWKCPPDMTLCDGIVIDESTWADSGLRTCGKPDGSCLIGTEYEKNLLDYRKICKNTVFYEYYMGNYGNRQKIMPAADELQSIFRHFMEVGISGSGTQMECFNLWNNLLNFYCFARTAYDTSLSLRDQIHAISALFGKGGKHIAEIFKLYEETLDGQIPISETGDYLAGHIDSDRIYELFEAALQEADSPAARNNVRLLRMVFRYVMLSTEDDAENKAPEVIMFRDPTGELAYMATHFDSYLPGNSGYGIAIPVQNRTDIELTDNWYHFE